MKNKIQQHKQFWKGEGSSLILIPPVKEKLYDLNNYPKRFYDPQLMWETEIKRAQALIDWPSDGIPTVRSNLGVVVVPAMAGQSFQISDNSMPWPGSPLSKEEIRTIRNRDLSGSEIFSIITRFYEIYQNSRKNNITAYLPDTQGVFDIAHLLFGDEIFISVLEDGEGSWFQELMEISLQLYIEATKTFKTILNEEPETMIHGHGTEQGIYFPHSGVRIAEDTAILLSPEMIEQSIIPYIKRSIEPFNKAFLHYCGYHPTLFNQLSALPEISAIDLGNPELYDTRHLLEQCAATGTVLYSRIAEEPGEGWSEYIHRIGSLVTETNARVILRPQVFPESKDECREMLEIWHEITSK